MSCRSVLCSLSVSVSLGLHFIRQCNSTKYKSLVLISDCWQWSADLVSPAKIRKSTQWKHWVRISGFTRWWREEFRLKSACQPIQRICGADDATSPEILSAGLKNKLWVLLSPPGVFGGVETGQVFVFFDDIHLSTGPAVQNKSCELWVGSKWKYTLLHFQHRKLFKNNWWKIFIWILRESFFLFSATQQRVLSMCSSRSHLHLHKSLLHQVYVTHIPTYCHTLHTVIQHLAV